MSVIDEKIDARPLSLMESASLRRRIDFTKTIAEKRLLPLVQEYNRKSFDSEGFPSKWAPLSERYAKKKLKKYGRKPILVARGTLKQAATEKMQVKFTPGGIEFFIPRGMWTWAALHQYGRGNLPKRSVVKFDNSFLGKLTAEYESAAKEVIREMSEMLD